MPCETVGHVCQKGLWEACYRICTCIRWFGRGGGMNGTLLSTAAGEERVTLHLGEGNVCSFSLHSVFAFICGQT